MYTVEQFLIQLLTTVFSQEQINTVLSDPRTVATIIGGLIAISGALLGTFLLLRRMSLTTDAISHTVLLGIVTAFMVMVALGLEADLSSPLLILGAAIAGVVTVLLTEAIYRSGLVKADAALGLAFPFLFALSIILISRFTEDVHLDTDAVMVGEIGIAWANTNSHCLENCESVTITADDPRAEVTRTCTNCRELGISPRDDGAIFAESCSNCGTYSPGQAWREGLIATQPLLVFWPKSITVTGVLTLLTIVFVVVFYKELKLTSFDAALAASLGFRPGLLNLALMVMVSLVAVGAFDAVGSILVIAFFIIPPAAAYLLTDRLAAMLFISPVIGAVGAYTGYDLSRGSFLGIVEVSDLLRGLDNVVGLGGYTEWNVSISASMVMMLFILFVLTWILSPRYGLISTLIRRQVQNQRFADQMVMGHIYNHQNGTEAEIELARATLHEHLHWTQRRTQRVVGRLRTRSLIQLERGLVTLTERGTSQVEHFRRESFSI